jgi:hypothetical protein
MARARTSHLGPVVVESLFFGHKEVLAELPNFA